MIAVDSKHPPGTVGYWTAWHPRYWQFLDCLTPLQVPKGTRLLRVQGDSSPAGCNKLTEALFDPDWPANNWIWFLPDDHTFEPDTLMRLLDRDKDVIAPSVCRRFPPEFESVAYKLCDPKTGMVQRWAWPEIAQAAVDGRLLPCQALGGSGLLIKKHVFEKVEKPYFVNLIPEQVSEDIDFTNRLHEAGVELWFEPRASLTHLIDGALEWRFFPDGTFGLGVNIGGLIFKVSACSEKQSSLVTPSL